jgi:hypothetical protein
MFSKGKQMKDALKLALEYLEDSDNYLGSIDNSKPIAAIKQALAAPTVQEPVAWQVMVEDEAMEEFSVKDAAHDWCVQQKLAGSPYSYWIRPLYITPTAQEFVCSTGLCHYKAKSDERLMETPKQKSEKRECMNCAAFGECNPNNDTGRCGYEPPAAKRQWVGLTDEEIYTEARSHEKWAKDGSEWFSRGSFARAIEAKLKEKNT